MALRDVIAVVLGGGRGVRLHPLTLERAKSEVPFGPSYRIVDFPVSNCLNSGIDRIFILTQISSFALSRHVASAFHLDTLRRGFVELVAAESAAKIPVESGLVDPSARSYEGTATAMRRALRHIGSGRGEHVLILSGDHVYRMDYRKIVEFHRAAHGAEITLCASPIRAERAGEHALVRVNAVGRVIEYCDKPAAGPERERFRVEPRSIVWNRMPEGTEYLASMGLFVAARDVLLDLLERPGEDFAREVVSRALDTRCVYAFVHTDPWWDVGDIPRYYRTSLSLADGSSGVLLDDEEHPIYTRPRYLPPVSVEDSQIDATLLGEGAHIRKARIERSVIGLRARVRQDAVIRDAVVLGADSAAGAPSAGVGEGALVERAIVDRNARIGRGAIVRGEQGLPDGSGPGWVVRSGIVVVAAGANVPDGSVVGAAPRVAGGR